MSDQTVSQIEQELAKLEQELAAKRQILEEQKQAEIAELKAQREAGIRAAWSEVTQEFVKAGMVTKPDYNAMDSERGQKMAETKFNKKCFELLGEVLGIIEPASTAREGRKNKRLNDDQKAKIEGWLKEGMTVGEMNKRLFTAPDQASYQRVNTYVKKLQKAQA